MIKKPKEKPLINRCVWDFSDDKALRKSLFTDESFSHPAKMSIALADAIVGAYVNSGDIVLDPMSGIGTTGVAVLRNGKALGYIGLELEPTIEGSPDFVRMQVENLEGIDSPTCWGVIHGDSTDLGWWQITPRGDNRYIDVLVVSPPFGPMSHSMGKAVGKDFADKYPSDCHYSDNKGNVGNLRTYGDVDTIILSPPFPCMNTGGSLDNLKSAKISNRNARKFSNNPENVDNLKVYGDVDKIIVSPPFGSVVAFQDPNISKWRRNGKISERDADNLKNNRYSKNKDNVGRGSDKSYWEQMYLIYANCVRILKSGGLFITHTKCYVRKGQVVQINLDTIKALESLGLKMLPCPKCGDGAGHTHRRRIKNPSFWVNSRTKQWLARPENGDKEASDCPYYQVFEDICVFQK